MTTLNLLKAEAIAPLRAELQAGVDAAVAQAAAAAAALYGAETALAAAEDAAETATAAAASAQSSALTCATWSVLVSLTGATDGMGAEVLDSDAGTHSAATGTGYDGSSVSNAGRYSWNAAWSRWVRIGNTGLSAVNERLASLPTGEAVSDDAGVGVALTDENGAPTWLQTDLLGNPTADAAARIGAKLTGANTPSMLTPSGISDDSGIGFVITGEDDDGADIVTDLELAPDGRFTDRVIRGIAGRLTPDDLVAALGGFRSVSGPDIACLGDSLTAGAGGTPYPSFLATLLGTTCHNLGVGGETSRTITGRIGARPWLATISGGSIPTSGGVTVTLAGDDGAVSPLDQGNAGINPCSIAGVTGTLSKASGVYTFTRTTAGDAVSVPFPAPVITAAFTDRANDILVIEMGQNDGTNDATDIIARCWAIIEWMAPLKKRWLVLGLSTSTAEYRAPYEAQMLRAFGRRFVNIREWLSSEAAMAYVGLTPTPDDLAAIAVGAVPPSMLSDETHLNSYGYEAKAYFVGQRVLELSFLED